MYRLAISSQHDEKMSFAALPSSRFVNMSRSSAAPRSITAHTTVIADGVIREISDGAPTLSHGALHSIGVEAFGK